MTDSNPRPSKRSRVEVVLRGEAAPSSSKLKPIPPQHLLLNLPALLIHPPDHPLHLHSLSLSLTSLRKCLGNYVLDPGMECRAWCALAEVGMMVVKAGVPSMKPVPEWASNMDNEIEKAISKGLILAQKHPSLHAYKHRLTLLHAFLAQHVHSNVKFARSLLKRLISSFNPNTLPHQLYAAHLALIDSFLSAPGSLAPHPPSDTGPFSQPAPMITPQDIQSALAAIATLQSVALENAHSHVILLTLVLRLRTLVSVGMWEEVASALSKAEEALGLSYDPLTKSKEKGQTSSAAPAPAQPTTFIFFKDPFESSMAIHTLIIGVLWFIYAGLAAEAAPRLSHLHALLDEDALHTKKEGMVEINFAGSPPLILQTTHPRILYLLGFLVSATAKRDALGRNPKRKLFATQGLVVVEKEEQKEISLPTGSSIQDLRAVQESMARIKADLMSELIGVSILRSEFDAAEENLALLIAHTRNTGLFPAYAARITLHHAHLAHSIGETERAKQCYLVAEHMAKEGKGDADVFVEISARAGLVGLEIGLAHGGDGLQRNALGEGELPEALRKKCTEVVKACMGKGATLTAVGRVLDACLVDEILGAKQHLKTAFDLASLNQDNHLRALTLAFVSSHFFHTDSAHAMSMLTTCEQLAAGLGAAANKGAEMDKVGNVPLRLWVGERFVELYKRAGKDARAEKQILANDKLRGVVDTRKIGRRITPHVKSKEAA